MFSICHFFVVLILRNKHIRDGNYVNFDEKHRSLQPQKRADFSYSLLAREITQFDKKTILNFLECYRRQLIYTSLLLVAIYVIRHNVF